MIAATGLVGLASGLVAPSAHASNLSTLQAQATALAARIQSLGQREDALSEQYDGARLELQQDRTEVAAARKAVAAASAGADKARAVLQAEAINAYVSAGTGVDVTPSLSSANEAVLRAEYEQSLASDQADAEDAYHLAVLRDAAAESELRHEEAAAAATVASIDRARAEVEVTQSQLEAAYSEDQGRIATLVAEQQAAEQQAAEQAAEQRLAAEQAEASLAASSASSTVATSSPDGPSPATSGGSGSSGYTPPPLGSAAAIAVAAAESRVGDPYVWGAAGPNAFDCSGLVMWAYEQAGIDLPHFSGAQYADTVHIPMSDIEPGDLLFFSNPDIHVAMYIGNGEVIQAPYTGADVQIVPIYPELALASRVE